MNRWTQSEIELLMERYSNEGPKALVSVLNRNLKTISKKAVSLGLKRSVAAGNISRANHWSFEQWSYSLGYVVGVYLGDGNIYIKPNQTAYFKLDVIDQDFCKATQYHLYQVTGLKGSIRESKQHHWIYRLCNKSFVYWLRDNFGGPKNKTIKLLPNMEANKGMIEGLYDSEGTVGNFSFNLRMSGDLLVIQTIFQQLEVRHPNQHKGVRPERWFPSLDFQGYSISNKEYTRIGLGTYINRKAVHGLIYKSI